MSARPSGIAPLCSGIGNYRFFRFFPFCSNSSCLHSFFGSSPFTLVPRLQPGNVFLCCREASESLNFSKLSHCEAGATQRVRFGAGCMPRSRVASLCSCMGNYRFSWLLSFCCNNSCLHSFLGSSPFTLVPRLQPGNVFLCCREASESLNCRRLPRCGVGASQRVRYGAGRLPPSRAAPLCSGIGN